MSVYLKIMEDVSVGLFFIFFLWLLRGPKDLGFQLRKDSSTMEKLDFGDWGQRILERMSSVQGKIVMGYIVIFLLFQLIQSIVLWLK